MKARYLALALIQAALIACSAALRRTSWLELDFPLSQSDGLRLLDISGYAFLLWGASIIAAVIMGVYDKQNRSLIFLSLVVLLPFVEFWGWLIYAF